ncbi:hypothetical protein HHI36_006679 [Cryptolaemus montrouzieri]|uniref:Uncharacterized protein n=1 Tax=Cryptolaemus montrouzieri TaxID=559131 RepID=A0ABD2NY36_9CUCU
MPPSVHLTPVRNDWFMMWVKGVPMSSAIVFNNETGTIEQPNNQTGRGCSQYKEEKKVFNILKKLKENINANSFKMHRLGAHNQNKKRPIRVIFQTKQEALEILKLRNNLRDSEVYITSNTSPAGLPQNGTR